MQEIFKIITALAQQYSAEKVVLFGSRARGDNSERSDIDLAIWGIKPCDRYTFEQAVLESAPTLLEFDFVYVDEQISYELLAEIEKDGVMIYGQS